MIKSEYFRIAIQAFLGLWILTSLVAIAGMYRLWWKRERKLYLGKDIIPNFASITKMKARGCLLRRKSSSKG